MKRWGEWMLVCPYDAIVFDFDGTLVDSAEIKTKAFGNLYKLYGTAVVEQVESWHKQHEGLSRFVKFRHWQEHILNEPYTDEIGKKLSDRFSQLVVDMVVQAPYIEGAIDFLEEYYQKLPLYIASGTPVIELREIVLRKKMDRYFCGVFGSPETKAGILERLITEKGWAPERVLMIGDSVADYDGACQVGAVFLGIQVSENGSLPIDSILLKNLINLKQYL